MKIKDKVTCVETYWKDESAKQFQREFRGTIVEIVDDLHHGIQVEGGSKGEKEKRKIWFERSAVKALPKRVPKKD